MYGNPYYNQTRYQNMSGQTMPQPNYVQTIPNTMAQPLTMPSINSQLGLLGKSVDSIDVVRAMDIPLDGSVSYFPLTDGSAIVTKRLLNDGTSKTIIYKPIEETKEEPVAFVTFTDLEKAISNIDFSEINDVKAEIKTLKEELKDLKDKKSKEK